jgi:fibronectin-binding autotransporter adhesin
MGLSPSSGVGNPTLSGAITLNKDATFAVTQYTAATHDRLTLSGTAGGAGGIIKTNSGILILSASNNYSGATDIQGGKLYLDGAGRLGSGAVTIASGANLDFATGASGTNVVANNISGAGQIFQNVASTDTRFTGNVTSTGGMQILNGTVRIGNSGTTGSYTGNTAVSAGATIAFSRSDAYSYGGTISGSGNVTKVDAGATTLTGNNSYSGQTSLFAGALVADNVNALGSGTITFSSSGGDTGTSRYTAASAGTDWASRIKNSAGTIRLDTNSNNVSLAGIIDSTNTNGLVKSG